jgi:hypothetical protein
MIQLQPVALDDHLFAGRDETRQLMFSALTWDD